MIDTAWVMPEGAGVAADGAVAPATGESWRMRWGTGVALAVAVAAVYAVGLPSAGFFDNEGRFVEGAREMRLRGDYVTPHVNGVPILTKPPLTQWLVAGAFALVGTNEWARLVTVLAAMLTLVATWRLGTRLYDRQTGLVAGIALATMLGFVLEARTLRPDAILVACSTWALLCWHEAETGPERTRGRWLVGFWTVLGVGILAKGLVPLVVVGPPIALCAVRRWGLGAVARMRPGLGLLVLAAVVLPWHAAAALSNPGFAWDYLVNQHLLFAFDRKEPRDSEGDTLLFFWCALLFRSAPWSLVAPLTLPVARCELGQPGRVSAPTLLLWAWALGHVALFSLTPSRLEHYTLPAHPALAILAARAFTLLDRGGLGRPAWLWLGVVGGLLGGAGLALLAAGRTLVSQAYWIPQAPRVLDLPTPAGMVLVAGGALLVLAAWRGSAPRAGAALALVGALMSAICATALVVVTPLFSWRPLAAALEERAPAGAEVVFEAPIEYQQVGGLNFYTGRLLTMLEPAQGFVAPTYLAGRTKGMFITRPELLRRWRSERPLLLVSDPTRRRDDPSAIIEASSHPLARFGDRWLLANDAAVR